MKIEFDDLDLKFMNLNKVIDLMEKASLLKFDCWIEGCCGGNKVIFERKLIKITEVKNE